MTQETAEPISPSARNEREIDTVQREVGRRIKALRLSSGLTLTQLSEKTGLSIGTLSQIERGLTSPTVRTLFGLGTALGVSPAWLLDPAASGGGDDPFVTRSGRGQLLINNRGLEKIIITPPAASRLKAFLVNLDPGASSGDEPYSHHGQEVGYVVSGSMELEIGDKSYVLNAGDCFAFDSDIAHRFSNSGSKVASILWVNAPPSS
ncbi:cupin domain-containing protein [Ancylobacter sp. WKF20]|uniref:helix-turn-helix domain-containing protein n=1 Tax=Ancylobacter sp. WKF20 TaxID=3039801 RepID=UPI0024345BE4|nr:cupin domain-containing protein [Ancylobacter sp. WKF20]WGD28347.1 cupin domain-containing protein [Ancylobacter sp. WKF20]